MSNLFAVSEAQKKAAATYSRLKLARSFIYKSLENVTKHELDRFAVHANGTLNELNKLVSEAYTVLNSLEHELADLEESHRVSHDCTRYYTIPREELSGHTAECMAV